MSQWGLSVAMETIVLIQFDQDWPTGFRDIQVQKYEIFVTKGQLTPK